MDIAGVLWTGKFLLIAYVYEGRFLLDLALLLSN